jgi:MFS superfamily sulfate permease-like transporter
VGAFGGGIEGWKFALGVMVVAGVLQILMGLAKWGKFVDIFPLSAVHGMLAAIGLIIIAKQVPVLLNVDPLLAAGKSPFALYGAIPEFLGNLDPGVSVIGIVSLIIMIGWGFVRHPKLKMIPAPLLVLLFAIPAGIYLDLQHTAPSYTLVEVGRLADQVGLNSSFGGFSQTGIFIKFVIMVSLVGTLESLLTVKAIDGLDPWKRKADPNKDIIAIGVSNTFSGLLGGLPMISEVARSSANVAQGARTRWANFFHGLFLLLSALLAYRLLEMIPNAALAAMLIAVGFKLAHPKEFMKTFKIGSDQLAIFVSTIVVTLAVDLLMGIAAGMVLKAIIHVKRGAPLSSMFRAGVTASTEKNTTTVTLGKAAVFTNYLGLKEELDKIPPGQTISLDLSKTVLIDHSVLENLHQFESDYTRTGGTFNYEGLDDLKPLSAHPYAARQREPRISS